MTKGNFAELLLSRCSTSTLIDASTGNSYSRGKIGPAVKKASAYIQGQGLKPGDKVIIYSQHNPLSSLVYLACLHAGLVVLLLEPAQAATAQHGILKIINPQAIWSEDDSIAGFDKIQGVCKLIGDITSKVQQEAEPVLVELDSLAMLTPTSGTFQKPRIVMVSHENLISNTLAIVSSLQLKSDDRAMLILPISYCFGASVFHSHLYAGGDIVYDKRFIFPDKVLQAIADYQCTSFAGVPSVFNILLKRSNLERISMPSLRRFLQAGGPISPSRIEEIKIKVPNVHFCTMYGQTEATARISCMNPQIHKEKLGSVGPPLDNLNVRIVDEQGDDVPHGESGRIFISGPSVCLGYWQDENETRLIFDNGWLNTRDVGKLDPDGYLWIEGREGEFIKTSGRRISYAEVEDFARKTVGIKDAGVYIMPHDEAGEVPAIAIVLEKEVNKEYVLNELWMSLPKTWLCQEINIVNELPMNSRGKLDRKKLQEIAAHINGN